MTVVPILIGALVTVTKTTRELRNKRTSGDNLNYSIAEIGQNTEKSQETWGDCSHSNSTERPSVKVDVKTPK